MASPWRDLAEKTIGPNDTVKKSYPCNFNKQYGYLCLGKNKMVFVSEKGFFKKKYEVLLDAPYQEVNIRVANRFGIDLVNKDKTNHIETAGITAKNIVQAIEDVSKSFTQTTVTH